MVGDRECGCATPGNARLQGVRAHAETLHEAHEPTTLLAGPEAVRDVLSVRQDLDLPGRHLASGIHADQDVASRDQVRTGGEALDPEVRGLGDL